MKRKADWLWGDRLGTDFKREKTFQKGVKRGRKIEQARDKMVINVNGQMLRDGVEVRGRWEGYLEQVLNVEDLRKANVNVVANRQQHVL